MMTRRGKCEPIIKVEYLEEAFVNGRHIKPGTEVSISRERGRFRFINATMTSQGQLVLNFVGGAPGREALRSFYPERVRRVHRINRLWANRKEEE
jgi:hypothetical protein